MRMGRSGTAPPAQVEVAHLLLGRRRRQAEAGRAEQARGPRPGADDHGAAADRAVVGADGDPAPVVAQASDPGVLAEGRHGRRQRPQRRIGVDHAGPRLVQHRAGHGGPGKPPGHLGRREQLARRSRGQHGLVYRVEFGAEGQLRDRRQELGLVDVLQLSPELAGLPGQRDVLRIGVAEPEDPATALRSGARMPHRGLLQHGHLAPAPGQGSRRGQPQQPGTDDHELAVLARHHRQDKCRPGSPCPLHAHRIRAAQGCSWLEFIDSQRK